MRKKGELSRRPVKKYRPRYVRRQAPKLMANGNGKLAIAITANSTQMMYVLYARRCSSNIERKTVYSYRHVQSLSWYHKIKQMETYRANVIQENAGETSENSQQTA